MVAVDANPYDPPKTEASEQASSLLLRFLHALLAVVLAGFLPLILLFFIVVVAVSVDAFSESSTKGIATAVSGTAICAALGWGFVWIIQGSLRKAFGNSRSWIC